MQKEHYDNTKYNLNSCCKLLIENVVKTVWMKFVTGDCLELFACKLPRAAWPEQYLQPRVAQEASATAMSIGWNDNAGE